MSSISFLNAIRLINNNSNMNNKHNNLYSVIIFCPEISLPLYLNLVKCNHD